MSFVTKVVSGALIAAALSSTVLAQINITGKVVDVQSAPIANVRVGIAKYNLFTLTKADGTFAITSTATLGKTGSVAIRAPRIHAGMLTVTIANRVSVNVAVFNAMGKQLYATTISNAAPGEHSIPILRTIKSLSSGILFIRLKAGDQVSLWRQVVSGTDRSAGTIALAEIGADHAPTLAKTVAAGQDTVSFTLETYIPHYQAIDNLGIAMGTITLRKEVTGNPISIAMDQGSTQQVFGATLLETALRELNRKPVRVAITAATGSEEITVQKVDSASNLTIKNGGFQISNSGGKISIKAIDHTGAMYGMQEVGELIAINGLSGVPNKLVNPRFPLRAIKFNIPWSTYRSGQPLHQHRETCKDLKFWESFLTMMAENRFSTLSLWFQHPFPYFVRATNFPKACSFSDAEMVEWRKLWTGIFQMAKDRGIETYLVTWNIFVSKGFKDNYSPNSLVDDQTSGGNGVSDVTCDKYHKESITQLINEYPGLTGLGVTLGEGMNNMSAQQREQWLSRTYIPGINAANRKIKFIHRAPMYSSSREVELAARSMIESIPTTADNPSNNIIAPIEMEIKFNWSHGHSTPNLLLLHGGAPTGAYWTPLPTKYRMDWMIRNEDFFILRWGQPDFIRRHIAANGQSYVGGYFVGSESYIPALDYIHVANHPHINWKYAFERQWLFYKQWGRLLYDPTTPDKTFEESFDRRFGKGVGAPMVKAYKLSSDMQLRFACMNKFTWDFTLYSEGFGNTAFLTLSKLISAQAFDTGYYSIANYVADSLKNAVKFGKITPLELADTLMKNAEEAMALVAGIAGVSPTLACEIEDVKAWCHLSKYFSRKLKAGVLLHYYSTKKVAEDKTAAVALLQSAKTDWANLVTVTKLHHRAAAQMPTGATTPFSWENYVPLVDADIKAAQGY